MSVAFVALPRQNKVMTTIVMLLLAVAFMLTIFAYLVVETERPDGGLHSQHHAASSARMSKVAVERPGRWR